MGLVHNIYFLDKKRYLWMIFLKGWINKFRLRFTLSKILVPLRLPVGLYVSCTHNS